MRPALLIALFAAGCVSAAPAPIIYGGAQATRARPPEPRAPRQPLPAPIEAEAPRPAPQQPAPDWADGEGTPLSAYALRPEQAHPYDPANPPRTHRVGPNESLYDIATRYQTPLRALIEQNNLEPPFALTPGRELELPPPRLHTVRRGETFADIAQAYNVDLRSLALLNRMQAPYMVRTGDRIVLPALARARGGGPPSAADVAAAPPPATAQNARFVMPLRGPVVARFGAQPDGARLDGVEIAGRDGDAVLAAAAGEVVYAGADLPAYGTLVLIRHADNYVTAYGYNRRAAVREGQHVRAGERIAELGERGRLLFQVRQGSAAVDPAPLLGIRD